jgi:hypothetical protein
MLDNGSLKHPFTLRHHRRVSQAASRHEVVDLESLIY